ncbi:hypothetical protein [Synechococcus sp. UW179A]|uniref:hypothetical protein n=1 Tax=Synechococcus sp. UW179A TaxID=2575510 RepID=UPI0010BF3F0C|nr:hypothetical protein [Synechococcus sp. UW179A]
MPFGAAAGTFDLPFDKKRAEEFMHVYEKLVAESWTNPELKERMKSDLTGLLQEHGLDTEGRTIEAYETPWEEQHIVHLPLPRKPSSDKLSEEQLASLSGGTSSSSSAASAGTVSCPVGTAGSAGSAGSDCSGGRTTPGLNKGNVGQ